MTDSPTQNSILIIDDSADVTIPLNAYFTQEGVAVTTAQNMEKGLAIALQERPNIILLAATLDGMDGLLIFRQLRDTPLTAHIPIMFIADYKDALRQNQLLAAGADDVITRPFDVEILALRVRNAIKRASREGLTDAITSLPTALVLAEKRRELADQTGWTALTISIEYFDSFRARYDFITGNEVLRYAANIITEIAADSGDETAFVGCPAEAQFVVLVDSTHSPALEAAIQTRLGEGVLNFYNFMEREQGYVQIEDGRGGMEQFPLMAVRIERDDHA